MLWVDTHLYRLMAEYNVEQMMKLMNTGCLWTDFENEKVRSMQHNTTKLKQFMNQTIIPKTNWRVCSAIS